MFSTQLKRITKAGVLNSMRNPFLSFSSIFIITITLFTVGLSILSGKVLDDFLDTTRDKVDITVYFVKDTPEIQIFELRDKINTRPEVKEVNYVSQEDALDQYKKRNDNDLRITRGLETLGENPFRARLSVKKNREYEFETI